MSVPVLNTFVAGQKITAAQLNANTITAFNSAVLYKPICKMTQSAAQSIPSSGSYSFLTGFNVDIDTDTMADTANNRMVFTTPGLYRVSAQVSFAAGGTSAGYRGVGLNVAGSLITIGQIVVPASSTICRVHCETIVRVTAGQTMQLAGGQAGGTALNTDITFGGSHMTAEWLAA